MRAIFLILALWASSAVAEVPQVLVTSSGYFLLDVSPEGVPTVKQVAVLDLRDSATPPAPPTQSSPDTALSDRVRDWAREESDSGGAGVLAMVYGQISEAVKAELVKPLAAPEVIAHATDKLVGATWLAFRTKIGSEAADRLRRGELTDAGTMSDFLLAVSIGLAKEATKIDLPHAVDITATINQSIDAIQ
jgi:hypothetical protein